MTDYHKDIYTLPLSKFEDCLLNGNHAALIISGFPDPKELEKAWENIMLGYTEAMGDHEYRMYTELYREFESLRIDYASVELGVGVLRKQYSEYIATELSKIMRVRIEYNPRKPAEYLATLDRIERRNKGKKISLDLKALEFEAIKNKYNEKDQSRQALDRDYFTAVLIILSKHNGYEINNSIFVHKYCLYVRQRNKDIEGINEQVRAKR